MKRHYLYFLCISLVFTACVNNSGDSSRPDVAKGHVVYGGSIRISGQEKLSSLFPPSILDVGSFDIASQVHLGLLRFNPRNIEEVLPAIAKDWSVDESGLLYTFQLNPNVKFANDPCFEEGKGRSVTATDVKFSFELLCSSHPENFNFGNTFQDRVKGANAYRNKEATEVTGIKVLDPLTIQIELEEPSSTFLYILASPSTSIVAKEAFDKYGSKMTVGAGPFRLIAEQAVEDELVLLRNNNYFEIDSFGNQLPYLDTVKFIYLGSEAARVKMFEEGNLDFFNGIQQDKVTKFVIDHADDFTASPPKFLLSNAPEMTTQYYQFNMKHEAFQNKKVRQAFSYAIDKEKIVSDVLKNAAYSVGSHGISPPTFRGYNIEGIQGYTYDPAKAKSLLAQAGYPGGKGFPTFSLEVNSGGTRNSKVATEMQKQLKEVLGVTSEVDYVTFAKKMDDTKYGRYDMARAAWVADYPTPETFLQLFYGKYVPDSLSTPSYPNSTRYINPAFDDLFRKGKAAKTAKERHEMFQQAEQLMMDDAPIIVLWYSEDYRLLQANVRNFYMNPMNALNLTAVYIKEREAEIKGVAD